jgi:5-methylcytosine-specific restriction enzyme A
VVRPCLGTPGEPCAELSTKTRCDSCRSKLNRVKGSSHKRGYTRRHRNLAARYLRLRPWCELRFDGCQRVATDADHRVPIRAGGLSVWSNYQSACRSCHAIKTAQDRQEYAR